MKRAIILHGKPDKEEYFKPLTPSQSNRHWIPWIQKQLILKGILAQTPELPEPYEPVYEKFCSVFNRFEIDQDTILIGHSCGGGFLVRWLSENKINVGHVILVAPWIDPDHELKTNIFDFKIDKDLVKKTKSTTIVYCPDDYSDIIETVNQLEKNILGIKVKKLDKGGHFTFDDLKTDRFPELLSLLEEKI